MGKYIHKFDSLSDYNNYRKNNYIEPWVSIVNDNGNFIDNYNKTLLEIPLTFEILENGTITYMATLGESNSGWPLQYKKNNGEWIEIKGSSSGESINVTTGDKIQFIGDHNYYYFEYGSQVNQCKFLSTCNFNLSGNIMSLINSTDFSSLTSIPVGNNYTSTFRYMFGNCSKLINVENLILPATTLVTRCYYNLFAGCTNLINVPKIPPVLNLSSNCFSGMFENCSSLLVTPKLLSTTMANNCYSSMFSGCTSLTTPPQLPAKTLASSCYSNMFSGCTSLISVPNLPATILDNYCYMGMFRNCTNLVTAPELPAATLTSDCYASMFYGCSKLNYIKCLATNISGSIYTRDWVNGVSATGTFIKDVNTSWSTGVSGIPSGWTIQNA